MKYTALFFLCLLKISVNSQIKIQAIATNHSGQNSYIIENSKFGNNFFYNVVLSDSLAIGDTIFRNNLPNPVTLYIGCNSYNKVNWFLNIPISNFENVFNSKEKIAQIIKYNSPTFEVNGITLLNPNTENNWACIALDSNGRNLNVINIGNEIKSQLVSSLNINGFSINNAGNFLISGYQRGMVNLAGNSYNSDTGISTYFIAEYNPKGALLSYKKLFQSLYPYILSRTLEYKNAIYFQTGFDSLIIKNNTYVGFTYQGLQLNDLALIQINKDTLGIANYAIMQDSSTNYQNYSQLLKINSNGIIWPIASQVASIKINNTLLHFNNIHDIVYLILNSENLSYKSKITYQPELTGAFNETDIFDDSSYIITFRNPGTYFYINDTKIANQDPNATVFAILEPNRAPYPILSISGSNFGVKLNKFNKQHLEILGNLSGTSSFLTVKSQNISRNNKYLNWPVQASYYIMDEFSGLIASNINNSFDIFPNPTTDYFNIFNPNKNLTITKIKIVDFSGKQVFESSFENSMKIETSNWSIGLYYIMLSDAEANVYPNKIIISR